MIAEPGTVVAVVTQGLWGGSQKAEAFFCPKKEVSMREKIV